MIANSFEALTRHPASGSEESDLALEVEGRNAASQFWSKNSADVESGAAKPSPRQSNSGLVAVNELNACSLQGTPNGCQIIDRWDAAALFEIANSTLAQIGPSSQFGLRPVEQSTSCPRLIGGHPTAISWDTVPSNSHEKR
jgi:hypothetical protein